MSEPTLADIAKQLQEFKQTTEAQFQDLNRKVDKLSQEIKEVKTAVDKLDNRLFEPSMRIVTANSSAFFGVGIALLSAAIAFVVARISGGSGL
jgi:prefoldin subunit 5